MAERAHVIRISDGDGEGILYTDPRHHDGRPFPSALDARTYATRIRQILARANAPASVTVEAVPLFYPRSADVIQAWAVTGMLRGSKR